MRQAWEDAKKMYGKRRQEQNKRVYKMRKNENRAVYEKKRT